MSRLLGDRWHLSSPGLAFPVVVFVVWRVTHGVIVELTGGDALDAAVQWDGLAYRRIMLEGYRDDTVQWFPAVPWLGAAFHLVVPSVRMSITLVANATALATFIGTYVAVRDWRDQRAARQAVVLLAVLPASFFLWAFYTEALTGALTAAAFVAHGRGRHGFGAAAAAAAAATRIPGVIAGVVVVASRLWRREDGRITALYVLATGAGLGVVLIAQWLAVGDALGWISRQSAQGRELTPPWVTVREGLGGVLGDDRSPRRIADVLVLALLGASILWVLLRRRRAWPPVALIGAVALAASPLFTGLLGSYSRLALVAWPAVAFAAVVLDELPPWVRYGVHGVLLLLGYQMLGEWADGRFVG